MFDKRHRIVIVVVLLALVTLLPTVVLARERAPDPPIYDLSWWTVDGGGVTSSGGVAYSLGGTAGQPDAVVWSGEGYTLGGGFWGGTMNEYTIYLPLILRDG